MDITSAQTLSRKLQISLDYVVREEYEILFLKEIFESEYGSRLTFKGGTALRLSYGSPRFSEDLDFTLIGPIDRTEFIHFLKEVGKKYPTIIEVEAIDKFYTVFALVRIKEDYLNRAFSIKIEVSKREKRWVKDKSYTERVIKSEVTPLTVLAQVASLEKILEEKIDALKNRKVARDVFDFWYINQLLKKEVKPNFGGYNKVQAKAELHKLLPKHLWRVIDPWIESE